MKVFSVFDSKAEAFLPPYFAPTTAVGTRVFAAAANDIEHVFRTFGGDFTLFELGSFDERVAKFDLRDAPENLGTAMTFQRSDSDG